MNQEELHLKITQDLNKTYIEKNADYGDAFNKSLDNHGLTAAIVRMEDKMGRFSNLAGRPASMQVEESLEDTLLDLANYAIMTVMWIKKNDKPNTVDLYADGELYTSIEEAAKKQREGLENREDKLNRKLLESGAITSKEYARATIQESFNECIKTETEKVKNLKPSKKPVLEYEYDPEFNRHIYKFMGRTFRLDFLPNGVEDLLVKYSLGFIVPEYLLEVLEKYNVTK